MPLSHLVATLHQALPSPVRWAGAVARRMRQFNIALENKQTGSSNTDALTLADLSVQELLVGALRDADPALRGCRIEAEETTGDLACFATDSTHTIALDPIDGTKQYRDRTGNGYSIILTLRTPQTLHYTLVFIPESGPHGTWVEVRGERVVCGPDDPSRPAGEVLAALPAITRGVWNQSPAGQGASKKIYMIGFQKEDRAKAQAVTQAGLEGVVADECAGCPYELIASGQYAGSLIHTPNVYDFPASLHLARVLGGDSLWVRDGRSVDFSETWMDERAKMLRLPGIVATSPDRAVLAQLCAVARDWNPIRYVD